MAIVCPFKFYFILYGDIAVQSACMDGLSLDSRQWIRHSMYGRRVPKSLARGEQETVHALISP